MWNHQVRRKRGLQVENLLSTFSRSSRQCRSKESGGRTLLTIVKRCKREKERDEMVNFHSTGNVSQTFFVKRRFLKSDLEILVPVRGYILCYGTRVGVLNCNCCYYNRLRVRCKLTGVNSRRFEIFICVRAGEETFKTESSHSGTYDLRSHRGFH